MSGYYKISNYQYVASNEEIINIQVIEYYDDEKNFLTVEVYEGTVRSEYDKELPQ